MGEPRTIAWVRNIGRLTGAEMQAIDLAAERIGTTADALVAVMQFESGLNPAAKNGASGATGLIQFLPSTAHALGTSTTALEAMSVIEQLPYVVRYFSWFKRPLRTVEELYCAVFWPAAIDKPDDYRVAAKDSAAYRQNAGFDVDKDGMITRAEICRPVKAILAESANHPRVAIPDLDGMSDEQREAAKAFALNFGPLELRDDEIIPKDDEA